jgi:UDP-glucose 4-epimerase
MPHNLRGRRVLVLGAAGYIGRELSKALVAAQASVRCFDRLLPSKDGCCSLGGPEPEWVVGDFADTHLVRTAVTGMDCIFHLISTTIPTTSNQNLAYDLCSNVAPTLHLLEAAREFGVHKLVFTSSGGTVYGLPTVIPVPEHHETSPICGYGIHKLAIEKYLNLYSHTHGLDCRILRIANPYGPTQISERPQGALGKFVYRALRREPIEIWGDGRIVRDYVHLDDVIEAFLCALEYSGTQRVFNIGSGIGHSLLDLSAILEKHLGRTLELRFLQARTMDVPLNVLDISRARHELHWHPQVDLHAGIAMMLATGRRLTEQQCREPDWTSSENSRAFL